MRRWRGAASPRTATRSSTPSVAALRRSRRTSSPGASSASRRTSEQPMAESNAGEAPGSGSPRAAGPLSGVTVLDLSSVGPASRCTRLLADYGATVVKIGPMASAGNVTIEPPFFAYSGHRGMRRVRIDLKENEGHEALFALARASDVLVESFRPGVAERLGLGY